MCLTGAFLVLFVTFHALMNGVAIFWPAAYNVICEFLGANWYALVGSLVLALGFIIHIAYATWLTFQNRSARGNARYEVTARQPQVEWSSKNMYVLGIVVVAFLVLHLVHFWSKMQLAEICGFQAMDNGQAVPAAAGTWFLQMTFSNIWVLIVYLVALVALWFHLTHGFWSMFQTCGWNGKIWMSRLKTIGNVWTTVVILLFAVEAVVFTVQARKGAYTSCPALQEQYMEMRAAHDAAMCATPCATDACDKAATCDKVATCDKAECGNQAKCANEKCADAACDPASCTCPAGTCGQEGICKENNCAGCPSKAVAVETETETVTE